MIFEFQTNWPQANEVDPYLNAMDAEDWELVQFIPIPRSDLGQILYVLTLHRRAVPAEEEAAHRARISPQEKAA